MQGDEELLTEPYYTSTVKEEVTKSTQQFAFFRGSLNDFKLAKLNTHTAHKGDYSCFGWREFYNGLTE